jgi:hypothetical protein
MSRWHTHLCCVCGQEFSHGANCPDHDNVDDSVEFFCNEHIEQAFMASWSPDETGLEEA